jgi:hypothetical protein
MKEFSRNNQEWKWHDGEGTGNGIDQRATLIVLDRRDDLASILRHDFTYQVSKFFFHFKKKKKQKQIKIYLFLLFTVNLTEIFSSSSFCSLSLSLSLLFTNKY